MDFIQHFYDKTPYFVQRELFNGYCYFLNKKRFTKLFYEKLEELEKSQWYTTDQLVEMQNEKLKILIEHAYETVPYYNKQMKKKKLTPQDIKTVNDIEKLPFLNREIVLNNYKELVSTKFTKKELIGGHTSGTTGSPLNFFWDHNMWFMNNVFDWRQKKWAGLNYGDPYGLLLGRPIVSLKRKKSPFWQYNRFDNQLWLSSFHLTKKNIAHYYQMLREIPIHFLEGYPSTLFIMGQLLNEVGKQYPLKATLTSSETLYDFQKETINNSFCCKNYDFYGLAERVIWATECEKHNGKHINMEYGITEVVNELGEVQPAGKSGYLVGTSLLNFGMPFIRYKTTDISTISTIKCRCGRAFPLMENITTKAEDLIYTPSGKYISGSILTHPFKPLHNIELSQIIQEKHDLITIKIVKRAGYSDSDTKLLLQEFIKRVGDDIDVKIKFVSDIPREKSGKFKWVISMLDRKELKTSMI